MPYIVTYVEHLFVTDSDRVIVLITNRTWFTAARARRSDNVFCVRYMIYERFRFILTKNTNNKVGWGLTALSTI